jgi:hypothetical protein
VIRGEIQSRRAWSLGALAADAFVSKLMSNNDQTSGRRRHDLKEINYMFHYFTSVTA